MELKTLLRLIKDDITQLDVITGEFDGQQLPLPEEIEVAFVRANALLRELELLHKFAEQHATNIRTTAGHPAEEDRIGITHHAVSEPESHQLITKKVNDHEPAVILTNEQPVTFSTGIIEPSVLHATYEDEKHGEELPVADTIEEAAPVEATVNHNLPPVDLAVGYESVDTGGHTLPSGEPEREMAPVVTEIHDHMPEFIAGNIKEEVKEVKKTLNETFGEQHQMVNDLLTPEKSETAYHIIPIQSIWDGIGINDRFLFIRELFANSSAKFETTVDTIDKLDSIQDAVNYLKMNFKWNKTEASQKFLVLVKRRFIK